MANLLVVGGAEEDVEVDAVAVEVAVEVVDEVCPSGAVEVLDVVCRGEVCRGGAVGVLDVVCHMGGAGHLVVYLIDVAHRGALLVGVCLEDYPNQEYSLHSQLQNQHLQRHQKQHP